MKKSVIALAALLIAGLSGCATKYQEMGMTGGVSAMQITSDTAQITARGNGYTDPDVIQRFAIRKAAETTLAASFDTFEVVSSLDRSRHGTEGSAYGNRNYLFGSTWQTLKPGETFMIKMRKGPKPDDAPPTWYDAHEVLNFLGRSDTKDARDCSEKNGKVECAGTN